MSDTLFKLKQLFEWAKPIEHDLKIMHSFLWLSTEIANKVQSLPSVKSDHHSTLQRAIKNVLDEWLKPVSEDEYKLPPVIHERLQSFISNNAIQYNRIEELEKQLGEQIASSAMNEQSLKIKENTIDKAIEWCDAGIEYLSGYQKTPNRQIRETYRKMKEYLLSLQKEEVTAELISSYSKRATLKSLSNLKEGKEGVEKGEEEIKKAAENYINTPHYDDNGHKGSFIAGAKWMKEYSQNKPV